MLKIEGANPMTFVEVDDNATIEAWTPEQEAMAKAVSQAVLRESLISLVGALRQRTEILDDVDRPQDSNFIGWTEVLTNQLCAGGTNKELRRHLKNIAKETWQLVNWLTHARNANKTASSIAIHSCQTVIGHFIQILQRDRTDKTDECPICKSRNVRTHFDISIQPDGDYYMSCAICDWTNHPEAHEK